MAPKKFFEVPYNPTTGSMFGSVYKGQGYEVTEDGRYISVIPTWRLNLPAERTLKFCGFGGSRGTNFIWEDEFGAKFPMFPSEMYEVLRECLIDSGVVQGTWVACKRGNNYGIRLAKPDEIV